MQYDLEMIPENIVFPRGSDGKESAYNARDLGWEDPLKEQMAMHSSILAWRNPWTEELIGLQSMVSQSQTWLSMHKHRCLWCLMSLMDIRLFDFLEQKFPFKAILKPPLKQTSWQGSWSELSLKIFSSNWCWCWGLVLLWENAKEKSYHHVCKYTFACIFLNE